MRDRILELLGHLYWPLLRLWGLIFTLVVLCMPLALAYVVRSIVVGIPAMLALVLGIVGAMAMRLPPWDELNVPNAAAVAASIVLTWLGWGWRTGEWLGALELLALFGVAAVAFLAQRFVPSY